MSPLSAISISLDSTFKIDQQLDYPTVDWDVTLSDRLSLIKRAQKIFKF
jgi:hypothetical protein